MTPGAPLVHTGRLSLHPHLSLLDVIKNFLGAGDIHRLGALDLITVEFQIICGLKQIIDRLLVDLQVVHGK